MKLFNRLLNLIVNPFYPFVLLLILLSSCNPRGYVKYNEFYKGYYLRNAVNFIYFNEYDSSFYQVRYLNKMMIYHSKAKADSMLQSYFKYKPYFE